MYVIFLLLVLSLDLGSMRNFRKNLSDRARVDPACEILDTSSYGILLSKPIFILHLRLFSAQF